MKSEKVKLSGSVGKSMKMAFALVLGMGGAELSKVEAQVAVVARDPANAYQVLPYAHVKRVLLYNYTCGGHSKTFLLNSMTRLARKYGFQLDVGGTVNYITAATLTNVDIAVFSNGDCDVLSDATSLAATQNFVQVQGKGLLQSHAAAAYIPCPTSGQENLTDVNCKWLARVLVRQYLAHDPDPHYGRVYVDSTLSGQVPPHANAGTPAATINHGRTNTELMKIFENLPSNNGVIGGTQRGIWDSVGDEWYNYRGYVRQQGAQSFNSVVFGPVMVLYSQDETAPYYTTTAARMGDRPQSWGRHVGNGLTVYVNHGHSDVYVRTRKFNNIIVNDSVMEKLNWRVLRYLARDFMGCMDNRYAEYNPDASVTAIITGFDDPAPCKTLVVPIQLVKGEVAPGITMTSQGLSIPITEKGTYRILVTDINGKQVSASKAFGGSNKTEIVKLEKGIYLVEVHSPKTGRTVTRVNF